MSITVTDPYGKDHRTVLFVDGTKIDDSTYRERAGRLIESLNGENIKVDLFLVRNGIAERISNSPDLTSPVPTTVFPAEELLSAGRGLGYDQVLLSTGR